MATSLEVANGASPHFAPSASTPLPLSSNGPSPLTPTAISSSSLPSIPTALAASSTFPPNAAAVPSPFTHHLLASLSSLHLSLSTFRASVDAQLLQHRQRYEEVRRELKADVERAREDMRQEAEQQRREEADERKRWKRDMRDKLTAAHRQLAQQQPASATIGGAVDEQRLRALVDERVAALTSHHERTIADLTHRMQLLESRATHKPQSNGAPLPPPQQQLTTSLSLSPITGPSTLSYPVRSLSPSPSPAQQPRGVLKRAVRFNEDVQQRMFSTQHAGDEEEREWDDDGAGGRGSNPSPLQQRRQEEDEFDMFQTRAVSSARAASPTSAAAVVSETKRPEAEAKEASSALHAAQAQQQQRTELDSQWTMLSTPAVTDSSTAAAAAQDESLLTSSSTSYSYGTPDDSPQQLQRQVQDELVQRAHDSVSDSSSDEEEEEEAGEGADGAGAEEEEMNSTDDEALDLTDLGTVAEEEEEEEPEQPPSLDPPQPTSHLHMQQPPQHAPLSQPSALSAYHAPPATNTSSAASRSAAPADSDSDSEDEAVVTRADAPRSALLSHLPPLSSLHAAGGARYKSSLAIRSTKPAGSAAAAVVGDSEAVQDILTGGRHKRAEAEEVKEAEADDEADDAIKPAQPAVSRASAAAAELVVEGSEDSDGGDGVGVGGLGAGGKWRPEGGVSRTSVGGTAASSKVSASIDSDDEEDIVVVKG